MPKVGLHVFPFWTAHFFVWTPHFGRTARLNYTVLSIRLHDVAVVSAIFAVALEIRAAKTTFMFTWYSNF